MPNSSPIFPCRARFLKRAFSSLSSLGRALCGRGICFFLLCALCVLCVEKTTTTKAQSAPARPKIYSIAFVRLKATDFEKSNVFYQKSLALHRGFDDCQGITDPCYAINTYQHVELSQTGSRGSDNFVDVIGFNVSDVDQMRKFLSSQGIQASPVTKGPNHLRFTEVLDPESNRIVFVELSGRDAQVNAIGQVSDRLIHAGLIVKDRAVQDHFYKDLLGFRPYWHGGMKDDETNWVSLQVPDGSDWLEYMLNVPADANQHLRGVMNHIALGVRDIQGAKAQLIKNGCHPAEEPKLGRDGKWQLNLYDPDDTRIEFMEFTPKEKPCCSEFTAPHPKP